MVHQVFHDIVCPPLLKDLLSPFNVDGPWLSVQSQSPPVPELEGKDKGGSADLQDHGVFPRAVDGAGGNEEMVVLLCRENLDTNYLTLP